MKIVYSAIIFFLFFFSTPFTTQGQASSTTLSGRVVDSTGSGIEYAAIALINSQQKQTHIAISGKDGAFKVPRPLKGKYRIEISYAGYTAIKQEVEVDETTTYLGNFTINESMMLDEAKVTASLQLVSSKVDRLVYDAQKDPDAANSSTLQLLNKLPFVEVDKMNDKITVMGESDFAITINGRENLMLSENNDYVAKLLKGDKLKEIELITSPDGKYAGKSAVINIVTTSSLPDGFVADVSASISNSFSTYSNIRFSSKLAKLIYNFSYEYAYLNGYSTKTWLNLTDYQSSSYHFLENYTKSSPQPASSHKASLNASYDISKFDLVSVKFSTDINDSHTDVGTHSVYRNANSSLSRELQSSSSNKANNGSYLLGVGYQRSFEAKPGRLFTFSYGLDTRQNNMKYERDVDGVTDYTDSREQTENDLKNTEHTVAADFFNPISGKQSYYFTAKYVDRAYRSDSWFTDLNRLPLQGNLLDELKHKQQLTSLAASYSLRGQKLMLTGEVSFEYTRDDIVYATTASSLKKDDKMLAGILRLTYRPAAKHSFMLSVRNSSYRPDIALLNPYEDVSIPGQISVGNPNLESEKILHSMLLYSFFTNKKLSLNSFFTFRHSGNSIQPYSYIANDGILVNTYENIGKENNFIFNLGANYKPTDWLNFDIHGNIRYNDVEYAGDRNSYWVPFCGLKITSGLWKGANISSSMLYRSLSWLNFSNIQAYKQHLILETNINISQRLGKKMLLSVTVFDPWTARRDEVKEDLSSDFYRYSKSRMLGRTISFRISYTFGRFKESVKFINREVQNTDRNKS